MMGKPCPIDCRLAEAQPAVPNRSAGLGGNYQSGRGYHKADGTAMEDLGRRLGRWGGAGLVLVGLIGCSKPDHPEVGRVSGVVTLDGQPLEGATVMFQPLEGRASLGTTDRAGKYTLIYLDGVPGARVGLHKVIIRTEVPGEDGQPPLVREKLPRRYHDQTELTAEVKPGSNTFDFALTSQSGGTAK